MHSEQHPQPTAPAQDRWPDDDRAWRDALNVRADLSDARRSILHRQEQEALNTLAAELSDNTSASRAREALLLRTDLVELALLKQARALAEINDALRVERARLDQLDATVGVAPREHRDDPRHVDNLNARLEALELWVLRAVAGDTAASTRR